MLASYGVLSLVVVASVRADKVTRIVCHDRALVTIELIDGQIRTNVDGVSQNVCKARASPRLSVFENAVGLKVADNVTVGAFRLGVELIDQPHLFRFLRVDLIHRGLNTLDGRRDQPESIRNSAAHIEALLTAGVVGIRHALLNSFPFQLREYNADIEHGAPHRGRCIEFLCCGHKLDLVCSKLLHHIGEVENGTTDAVQLVNNDLADHSVFDVVHHFRKGWAVRILPAVASVGINLVLFTSHFVLAELNLAFDGNAIGSVNGLSCVYCIHFVAPFS